MFIHIKRMLFAAGLAVLLNSCAAYYAYLSLDLLFNNLFLELNRLNNTD